MWAHLQSLGSNVRKGAAALPCVVAAWAVLAGATLAIGQAPAPPLSPEVHPDGRVTFRYAAPRANAVSVQVQDTPRPLAMTRDPNGVWVVTTPPMLPQIYDYQFDVDGSTELDPANVLVSPSLVSPSCLFTVPGARPELWEVRDVPHGTLHRHRYTSAIVQGLARGQSEYFVYTPPGYTAARAKRYPVLYLLHGWSDPASGWTAIGQADTIMDNLLATGRIVPMVVVMPLSYGDMSFVQHGFEIWNDKNAVRRNLSLFTRALFGEIVPRVEAAYAIRRDPAGRALAGVSMGGLESLMIGLHSPAEFAWIGAFSSAVKYLDPAEQDPLLQVSGIRLLWISCGTEDAFLPANRDLVHWLSTKHVPVTSIETPGAHTWSVWRRDLALWAPLLFAAPRPLAPKPHQQEPRSETPCL